ncbi:MAG: response regulator transcription factor [Clostridiaceae bacterium]
MYRVLIIEDDRVIAEAIKKHIEGWGYEARALENFQEVLSEFSSFEPHLVLIDVMLPFFNGFYWCGEIRKLSKVPIIFISSASDNMNIVMAVNMGGDDFITKPFDLNVLMAKMQAILRRTYEFGGNAAELSHRGAVLNKDDATLTYKDQRLELTKNDYKILYILMENKGRIISRDTLMNRLWETDYYVDENTLSVNVTRLRKKLDSLGLIDFIITKKGMGYIIE